MHKHVLEALESTTSKVGTGVCREGVIGVRSHKDRQGAQSGRKQPPESTQKLNVAAERTSSPWHSHCLAVETAFLSRPVLGLLDDSFATHTTYKDQTSGGFFLSGHRPPCASPESDHTEPVHTSLDHPPCRSHARLRPNEAAAGPVPDSMPTSPRAEAPPP